MAVRLTEFLSAAWPGGAARSLQILRDGFDSQLESIAFDIFTTWLLTPRAQAHFAVSLNAADFSVQYNNLKMAQSVIYYLGIDVTD